MAMSYEYLFFPEAYRDSFTRRLRVPRAPKLYITIMLKEVAAFDSVMNISFGRTS